MINDEDGTTHRRHPSPSVRVRDVRKSHKAFQAPTSTTLPGPATSAVTTVDRNRAVPGGIPLSAGPFLSEVKSHRNGTERSFENMLHANKQRAPAIENALAGLNISEKLSYQKKRSASFDLVQELTLLQHVASHFPLLSLLQLLLQMLFLLTQLRQLLKLVCHRNQGSKLVVLWKSILMIGLPGNR